MFLLDEVGSFSLEIEIENLVGRHISSYFIHVFLIISISFFFFYFQVFSFSPQKWFDRKWVKTADDDYVDSTLEHGEKK